MSTWDDKPNDYEGALAEIERLQGVVERIVRNETIEECARVAETYGGHNVPLIAAAIRALKR